MAVLFCLVVYFNGYFYFSICILCRPAGSLLQLRQHLFDLRALRQSQTKCRSAAAGSAQPQSVVIAASVQVPSHKARQHTVSGPHAVDHPPLRGADAVDPALFVSKSAPSPAMLTSTFRAPFCCNTRAAPAISWSPIQRPDPAALPARDGSA